MNEDDCRCAGEFGDALLVAIGRHPMIDIVLSSGELVAGESTNDNISDARRVYFAWTGRPE